MSSLLSSTVQNIRTERLDPWPSEAEHECLDRYKAQRILVLRSFLILVLFRPYLESK